jgi:hypothetical protein
MGGRWAEKQHIMNTVIILENVNSKDILRLIAALRANPAGAATRHHDWGQDANYPREEWIAEVSNGDTQIGYWDWVADRRD